MVNVLYLLLLPFVFTQNSTGCLSCTEFEGCLKNACVLKDSNCKVFGCKQGFLCESNNQCALDTQHVHSLRERTGAFSTTVFVFIILGTLAVLLGIGYFIYTFYRKKRLREQYLQEHSQRPTRELTKKFIRDFK